MTGQEGQGRDNNDFEAAAAERGSGLLVEVFLFLRDNKKWWLFPILATLLLVGVLVALGGGAAAPFIYTLF